MNLKNQIKQYRGRLVLSQDELAEKIYVTRQTVSNWETGKSYPDVNSLLLLSSLFGTTIDELVKGDIKIMKDIVNKNTVQKMKTLSTLLSIGMIATVVSAVPLALFLKWIGFAIWGVIAVLMFIPAIMLEKIKKENNVHTYKEILTFMEGGNLGEVERAEERGKKRYQQIFLMIFVGVITLLVCLLMLKLFA